MGLFAAGVSIAVASWVANRSDPGPNVLLITIDTLRADRLSLMGNPRKTSPSIDAWASGGVVFDLAYAPRGQTWSSLTSLFTGKYPISHGVRTNGDQLRAEHRTLAELLEAQGFATGAFLTNMTAAPNRGFDEKAYFRDPSRPQFEWDRDAVRRAIAFLEQHRDERFFAWVHLMDPHEPYLPPPPYDAWVGDYAGEHVGTRRERRVGPLAATAPEATREHESRCQRPSCAAASAPITHDHVASRSGAETANCEANPWLQAAPGKYVRARSELLCCRRRPGEAARCEKERSWTRIESRRS